MIREFHDVSCDLCKMSVIIDGRKSLYNTIDDEAFPIKSRSYYMGSFYDGHRNEHTWGHAHFCYKCRPKAEFIFRLLDVTTKDTDSYAPYQKKAFKHYREWFDELSSTTMFHTFRAHWGANGLDFSYIGNPEINDESILHSIIVALQCNLFTSIYQIEKIIRYDLIEKQMERDKLKNQKEYNDAIKEV